MRFIFDYILGTFSQYGYVIAKFGTIISSIFNAIRWFFAWKTEKEKRMNQGFSGLVDWEKPAEGKGYKIYGWGIGSLLFLSIAGFWVYSDYLDNTQTPVSVVRSYYNNIRIGNYFKALEMLAPELRRNKSIEQLQNEWKAYSGVQLCNIKASQPTDTRAVLICDLLVTARSNNRKKAISISVIVSKASTDDEWEIYYMGNYNDIPSPSSCAVEIEN